jgi:serralysin
MANDIYDIAGSGTALGVTLADDGTGLDWLILTGTYTQVSNITLQFTTDAGFVATSARGTAFDSPNPSKTLTVNGLIENARGSDSRDYMIGNTGNNILYGDNLSTGLGGNDTISADEGQDTVYGGAGSDELSGMEGNDLIYGDDGIDTIYGGSEIDTVEGGAGADSLSGGASIGDTVSYEQSDARVIIRLEFGTTIIGEGGHADNDSINGFSDVIGSAFGDLIAEIDSVSLKLNNAFYGLGGGDRLTLNGGNDLGDGGNGQDLISGGSGQDTLIGGADNDGLTGGTGRDRLTGGLDRDLFIFKTLADSTVASAGRDLITDFRHGQGDKIVVQEIDAKAGVAGNNRFTFIGMAAFDGDKGDLRIVKSGQNLIVQGDINGDRRADFAIIVENTANLQAGDFLL